MGLRFINRAFNIIGRLLLRKFDGVIRNGAFIPCDFRRYELVDKTKNLVLEKGKYKILPRDQSQLGPDDSPGMRVVDNSNASYDDFWGNDQVVGQYLDSSRVTFFNEVFTVCRNKIHGKVIDVGCGSGDFLKVIYDNKVDCKIYGMDFSLTSMQRCQKIVPSGEFLVGDIYQMKYEDSSFDVVIAMEILEHLEKPEAALKEMQRICRDGGTLIITVPNGDYDGYIGHLNFWREPEFRTFIQELKLVNFTYLEEKKSMLFILKN